MSRISGLDDGPIQHSQELDLGHETGEAPLGPGNVGIRGPVRPLPNPVDADGLIEAGHDMEQAESEDTEKARREAARKAGEAPKRRG
ncbi:MAG TPA: hypothetical protein VGN97_08755 [Mesorhizobium sp.]|nr:hypothetical protein [Mesorhizobium sp.]